MFLGILLEILCSITRIMGEDAVAKLNAIIALEKGIKSQEYSLLTELHKLLQKPDLFSGFNKAYQPIDEEGERLPPEQKRVQRTVPAVLREVQAGARDLWAITARKEWSNCVAASDILVDGPVPLIVERVPVTYLLFLEKQLIDLRTFIDTLPVLDSNEDWQVDAATGFYKTAPVQTHRTKKLQRPIVLYDATPEHPAQTQLVSEDVLAGYWSTVKQSGALAAPDKTALAERVEQLVRAVKEAREVANGLEEVPVPDVGQGILGWLFRS